MKLAALIAKDLVFPLAGCDQASDVLVGRLPSDLV